MAKGHEDWQIPTAQFPHVSVDTIEGAARMGSPGQKHRAGKILYLTGFECGVEEFVGYDPTAGLDGNLEEYENDGYAGLNIPAFSGKKMAKVTPPSGDPFYFTVKKEIPRIWSGNLGVEGLFGCSADITHFTMGLLLWTSTDYYAAMLGIDCVNAKLLYRSLVSGTFAQTYTEIDDLPGGDPRLVTNPIPIFIKLVIKGDYSEYVKCWVNEEKFDLSGNAIPSATPGASQYPHTLIEFQAVDEDGTQGVLYVDDIVLTVDEP